MTVWARAGKVLAPALFAIAVLIATSSPTPVAGLAVGDSWVYTYHQTDAGVEWVGDLTETYVGTLPGSLLGIRINASGVLVGDVTGTWTLNDFNAYRAADGAFVNSTSVLELQYVEFGDSFHIIDIAETSNNPPVRLGGSFQVGAVTSGTTTQISTRTVTVNGNTTGPTTTSTHLTITQTIVSRFQVSVPAGTFTAWQIRYTSSDSAGYIEHAYNETVGSSVRIQVFDVLANVLASLELREWSYRAGGPQGGPVPLATAVVPYAAVGLTAAVVAAIVWRDRRRPPAPGTPGPAPP